MEVVGKIIQVLPAQEGVLVSISRAVSSTAVGTHLSVHGRSSRVI